MRMRMGILLRTVRIVGIVGIIILRTVRIVRIVGIIMRAVHIRHTSVRGDAAERCRRPMARVCAHPCRFHRVLRLQRMQRVQCTVLALTANEVRREQ